MTRVPVIMLSVLVALRGTPNAMLEANCNKSPQDSADSIREEKAIGS